MPTKENSAGKQQPYDENTGKYTGFKHFAKPRDYDSEIQALKEKQKGLSMFSQERKDLTNKILQLEAEKEGFSSYDELKEFRHNQVLKQEKAKEQRLKQKEQLKQDYMMSHRPTETNITADNLIKQSGEISMPNNYYEILNKEARYDKEIAETMEQLNKVRNNPNADIYIYRATKGDTINNGDWITLSPSYAEKHKQANLKGDGKIIKMKVKAKDIQFAGDDIKEWGYFPR